MVSLSPWSSRNESPRNESERMTRNDQRWKGQRVIMDRKKQLPTNSTELYSHHDLSHDVNWFSFAFLTSRRD